MAHNPNEGIQYELFRRPGEVLPYEVVRVEGGHIIYSEAQFAHRDDAERFLWRLLYPTPEEAARKADEEPATSAGERGKAPPKPS